MKNEFEIAVFEGDGIGPEIMAPTVQILNALQKRHQAYSLNFTYCDAGAMHFSKTGESLPESSLETARKSDAILLSAMGMPDIRYEDGTEISPQIELRKELNLFAGVRPVTLYPGQNTPLKIPEGKTIDFVLIRESTEGLFWSQGKGEVSKDQASETLVITREISEKLFKFSFKLAQQRKSSGEGRGVVTCVDKANVFRAFAFFREIFDEQAKAFPDIQKEYAYVDATALWMVQKPWDFDVLVTENMFGDILSDLGAGLMGGLGLAPSADIGLEHALFQPCHGSAPDIAGKGVANPFAMILSSAMMLEWLGHENNNSDLLEHGKNLKQAVGHVIQNKKGLTRDIGGEAGTKEAASAILEQLAD
jgi:3-isopropylmalate dehydrogenase